MNIGVGLFWKDKFGCSPATLACTERARTPHGPGRRGDGRRRAAGGGRRQAAVQCRASSGQRRPNPHRLVTRSWRRWYTVQPAPGESASEVIDVRLTKPNLVWKCVIGTPTPIWIHSYSGLFARKYSSTIIGGEFFIQFVHRRFSVGVYENNTDFECQIEEFAFRWMQWRFGLELLKRGIYCVYRYPLYFWSRALASPLEFQVIGNICLHLRKIMSEESRAAKSGINFSFRRKSLRAGVKTPSICFLNTLDSFIHNFSFISKLKNSIISSK